GECNIAASAVQSSSAHSPLPPCRISAFKCYSKGFRMPTRALITGITGPVGSFLADYLLTRPDVEVHAFKRWRSDPRPIQHLLGRVTLHEGDIEDPFAVAAAVRAAAPDLVYHLAAQSYPAASWDAPITTLRTNVE